MRIYGKLLTVVFIEEFQDTGLISEHLLEKLKPISEVFVEELN